jgi:phage portal protein BeeE
LTRSFLPEKDRSHLHIEHVTDALVKTNLQQRFNAYRQACGSSWLTPNEVRRLDNRPPVEGGDELVRQAGQDSATPSNDQQDSQTNESDRDPNV